MAAILNQIDAKRELVLVPVHQMIIFCDFYKILSSGS